jgi:uncharacterized OB-fold protein
MKEYIHQLSGRGKVLSFTTIYGAAKGFEKFIP